MNNAIEGIMYSTFAVIAATVVTVGLVFILVKMGVEVIRDWREVY